MEFKHQNCDLGDACSTSIADPEAGRCERVINWECQTLCSQAATQIVYIPHFVCGLGDAADSGTHIPVPICADCLAAGFLPLRSYEHTIEWNSTRGGRAPRIT